MKPKTREEKHLQRCFRLATDRVFAAIQRLCQEHPSGVSIEDLEAALGRRLDDDIENPILEALHDAVSDAMGGWCGYSGDVLEDILTHLCDEGRIATDANGIHLI